MWSVKIICLLLATLFLFCYCEAKLRGDALSLVNLKVTNVAKTTQLKSIRLKSHGRSQPKRVNKFVPNNKYLEALVQVSKGVAEARAITDLRKTKASRRQLAFLKKLVKSAVGAKKYSVARKCLGYALHFEEELGINRIIQNLKTELGLDGFNELMSVNGDVTLMFTIDTTGSMLEEIRAAKEIVKSIAFYPRQSSVDYVLSPFNDPGFGPVTKYSSRAAFEAAINRLSVSGGGDCEELTFHGIIDAITKGKPKPGSPMFVFTDAGAKDNEDGVKRGTDEYNLDNAIGLALDYMIPVNFFYSTISGICKKPQTVQSFIDLAKETNGYQLLFNNGAGLSNMGSITAAALDGLTTVEVGSSKVSRGKRATGGGNKLYAILVDETMDKLIVTVTVASGNVAPVILRNHRGTSVIKTYFLTMGCVWVIENPHPGNWKLIVPTHIGAHSFKVTASSVSNIDFEYYFVLKQRRGSIVEVPVEYPLKGSTAKVKLLIPLKNKINTNSLSLRLIGEDGALLPTPVRLSGITATFTPPSQPFRFRLTGRTIGGYPFKRVSREIIKAKHILLRSIYSNNYFTIRRNPRRPMRTSAVFALHNSGRSQTFEIKVFSTLTGVTTSISRARIRVRPNGRSYFRVVFTVNPKVALGQSTTLLVIAKGLNTREKARLVTNLLVVKG